MVLLDTKTPGTSGEIYSEDAEGEEVMKFYNQGHKSFETDFNKT